MGKRECTLEGLDMNAEFWKDRKVFLTGHTGFKGGWLALWLESLGAKVTGYSLPPTSPLFSLFRLGINIDSREGDILDFPSLENAVQTSQPELIFHLAAQSLVGQGYHKPVETYSTNVLGTVHLLEIARATKSVQAIINITSDKCYENREWIWGYREEEPMGGKDPYSSSKGCAELITRAYRDSFFSKTGVALASVRAGNVIGGGDWAKDRLVPDVLNALAQGKPILLRNPNAVRPWQHVLEPLEGYLLLAERLFMEGNAWAEGWNFGPSDSKSVRWVAEYIIDCWGGGSIELSNSPSFHEAHFLYLDSTKARSRLGWHPRWNVDRALAATVDWHRAWMSGQDMRVFSISQIQDFLGT